MAINVPPGQTFQTIARALASYDKSVTRVVFTESCSADFLSAELYDGKVDGVDFENLIKKVKNKIKDQNLVQHEINIQIAEDTGVCTISCVQ